jgi:hypothetical protein
LQWVLSVVENCAPYPVNLKILVQTKVGLKQLEALATQSVLLSKMFRIVTIILLSDIFSAYFE